MGAVGWPDVAIALIAGTPAIITALLALVVRRQIQTPSGDPIGQVVERTHDTAIANNLHLRTLNEGKRPTDPDTRYDDEVEAHGDATGR